MWGCSACNKLCGGIHPGGCDTGVKGGPGGLGGAGTGVKGGPGGFGG